MHAESNALKEEKVQTENQLIFLAQKRMRAMNFSAIQLHGRQFMRIASMGKPIIISVPIKYAHVLVHLIAAEK